MNIHASTQFTINLGKNLLLRFIVSTWRWQDSLNNTMNLDHYFSLVSSRPAPGLSSLSLFLLSSYSHLCVFSTSGQAAYEATHVLHTPLADVLHRVCCGWVVPIHEKTSHWAWESSSGWKWCVNIKTGYKSCCWDWGSWCFTILLRMQNCRLQDNNILCCIFQKSSFRKVEKGGMENK